MREKRRKAAARFSVYFWKVGCEIKCCCAIPEAETLVCRIAKVIAPAISIRKALSAVSKVLASDCLKEPSTPRLKTKSSVPNMIPRIPASDKSRFVVSE